MNLEQIAQNVYVIWHILNSYIMPTKRREEEMGNNSIKETYNHISIIDRRTWEKDTNNPNMKWHRALSPWQRGKPTNSHSLLGSNVGVQHSCLVRIYHCPFCLWLMSLLRRRTGLLSTMSPAFCEWISHTVYFFYISSVFPRDLSSQTRWHLKASFLVLAWSLMHWRHVLLLPFKLKK